MAAEDDAPSAVRRGEGRSSFAVGRGGALGADQGETAPNGDALRTCVSAQKLGIKAISTSK